MRQILLNRCHQLRRVQCRILTADQRIQTDRIFVCSYRRQPADHGNQILLYNAILAFLLYRQRICPEQIFDIRRNSGIPQGTAEAISSLFARGSLTLEKKGKNGITQQDIIPMIRRIAVVPQDSSTLALEAVICCQNPALNPNNTLPANALAGVITPLLKPVVPEV